MHSIYRQIPSFIRHLKHQNLYKTRCLLSAEAVSKKEIMPPAVESEKAYPIHIVEIVDKIEKLTLLEVADLNTLLQDRLGIKPAAAMPMMAAAPTSEAATDSAEEQVPTKSSFNVKLIKFDAAQKVPLIKEIKNINSEMNLVQAKKFVESAPDYVKQDLSKDEAEEMKKALEALGATVEIE
ncbi:Ribosomal protein [Cichlidogyrus casuarinus]|uniref:Ribosomal protein n=1 Tax=Cichlidogyrus casuarinus TaxID=1844966 RepID=A0ABD2PUN6_9PLAT